MDGLVFTSIAQQANQMAVKYATNYPLTTRRDFAWMPKGGMVTLIVPTVGQQFHARAMSWLPEENVVCGDMVAGVKEFISSLHGSKPRVGLYEAAQVPVSIYRELESSGAEFVDITERLTELRAPKSEYELDLLRNASRIAVESFEWVLGNLRPGVTEQELIGGSGKLHMTRKQIIACIIFLFAIAYSVVLAFVDAESPFAQAMATFDQCTWFILALAIFFVLREDGKPLLNEEKTFRGGISWGIVLAVCIFNVIGSMLANPELGVRGWLNSVLEPVFSGLPFPVFMLLICFVSTIATNLFANAAVGLIVGTLTMPFAITYSQTIGINPTVYGAAVTMSAMFSFMTMAAAGYVPLFLTRPCIQKNQKFLWGVGGSTCIGGILLMTIVFTVLAYIL